MEPALDAQPFALQVEAGSVHCGAQIHPRIEQVQHHLEEGAADAVGAAGAEGDVTPVREVKEARGHHGGHAHVGRPAVEAAGVEILLAEHVVEHDAGAREQVTASLAVGDGERREIVLGVHHADVGGAAAAGGVGKHTAAVAVEAVRVEEGGGMGEPGLSRGEMADAGLVGEPHGLGERPQMAGRAELEAACGMGLQQLEGEGDEQAAGGGGRIGVQHPAPVAQCQRLPLHHTVAAQVIEGQMAAAGCACGGQPLRQLAPVEEGVAFARQRLQGIRELGLAQGLAVTDQSGRIAPAPVGAQRLGGAAIDDANNIKDVGLELVQAHASAGILHGRFHQARHGQAAEFPMDPEQPLHHAGDRHGAKADVELLLGGAEVGEDGVEVDGIGGEAPPGRLGEEVVEHRLLAGRVRHEKAAAAEGCQHRLGHAGGQQGGETGVEGVAAGLQHADSRLGGLRVAGRHHAARAMPGVPGGGGSHDRCAGQKAIPSWTIASSSVSTSSSRAVVPPAAARERRS